MESRFHGPVLAMANTVLWLQHYWQFLTANKARAVKENKLCCWVGDRRSTDVRKLTHWRQIQSVLTASDNDVQNVNMLRVKILYLIFSFDALWRVPLVNFWHSAVAESLIVLCMLLAPYLDSYARVAAAFSDRVKCSSTLLPTSPSKYVSRTQRLLSRTALTGAGAGLTDPAACSGVRSSWLRSASAIMSTVGGGWTASASQHSPRSTLFVWRAAADSSDSPSLDHCNTVHYAIHNGRHAGIIRGQSGIRYHKSSCFGATYTVLHSPCASHEIKYFIIQFCNLILNYRNIYPTKI